MANGAVALVFVVLGTSQTVAAFDCSLMGPGRTPSLTARPDFTVASIAPAILSRNALICSSVLPDTATSFAMMTCAIERLFFSACWRSSFIVA